MKSIELGIIEDLGTHEEEEDWKPNMSGKVDLIQVEKWKTDLT